MNAFEKIIGYRDIKTELLQICDMLKNRKKYEALGAYFPRGILLYGKPGLGKTLMAKAFIQESQLPVFAIKKNCSGEKFIESITTTFREAQKNAPAIVFLDDMDKFANEDTSRRDAAEYVAIQTAIDETKDAQLFILATANDIDKLPDSLLRAGRFDRQREFPLPSTEDCEAIVTHYLQSRKLGDDVNCKDVAKMIAYRSCAELENILNEAAICAGYAGRDYISMRDIVDVVLRKEYSTAGSFSITPDEETREVALHEAGHLVVCEVLHPESVGMASLRKNDFSVGGFIVRCVNIPRRPNQILVSLGGKAAVELYHFNSFAKGCNKDLDLAAKTIRNGIIDDAACGLNGLDVLWDASEIAKTKIEALTHAELERHLLKAKEILAKNRTFLEKATEALLEKGTLLYSDIRALRESVTITTVAV